MHSKLAALLFLTSYLSTTVTVANIYGIKHFGANKDTNVDLDPTIRYGNESEVRPLDVSAVQYRFADGDLVNSFRKMRKGSAPVAGEKTGTDSSFLDYFDVGGEDENEEQEEEEEEEEDDEEQEEEDDDNDEDEDEDDDKKKPPFLRGVRRKYVMAHKVIFPLLLAYKLKFFTMLPLLVGTMVLLVGTTSIAGFFFALFSAALGLQAKNRH